MSARMFDLAFKQSSDGTIRLEQRDGDGDGGEPAIIDLHPAQLRHVAVAFGIVAPNYQADDLSKRLAEQLCTIQRELADECHRSHWLELTFTKLDAWCSALPDAVFPYHLWDDSEVPGADAGQTPHKEAATGECAATPNKEPIKPTTAAATDSQQSLTF